MKVLFLDVDGVLNPGGVRDALMFGIPSLLCGEGWKIQADWRVKSA
jgi:hypothetical protein